MMNAQKFNRLLKKMKYNKGAANAIYEEFYKSLKAHFKRKFQSIDADDAVHDVFLKLMEMDTPSYVEYPAGWLYRIADNYIIDKLRMQKEEFELPENLYGDLEIEKQIMGIEVREAFKELDKFMQEVLYLQHWEGYTLKELAGEFHVSYGSLRTRVSRAYQILKKFL